MIGHRYITDTARQGVVGNCPVALVGVGGLGSRVVVQCAHDLAARIRLICMDTDNMDLALCEASDRLLLGVETLKGAGAGGDCEAGRRAAQESIPELRSILVGVRHVIIVAGMGGGTGSGAAPAVVSTAAALGSRVSAIVTEPLGLEARWRREVAADALAELMKQADEVVVLSQEDLALVGKGSGEAYTQNAVESAASLLADSICAAVDSIAGGQAALRQALAARNAVWAEMAAHKRAA